MLAFVSYYTVMCRTRLIVGLTLVVFCNGDVATWDPDIFQINSFVINSTESLRFATVEITSVIENLVSEDKELKFEIQIPKAAFISGFTLRVGNVEMKAEVAPKKMADDIYNDAKDKNITAGHVTQQSSVADDKDRDIFRIAVNIAKFTTVDLKLQYQELLERHAGVYKQKFYIFPRNIVSNILVTCEYTEKQDFTKFDFSVPLKDTKFAKTSEIKLENDYVTKKIEWKPDISVPLSDSEEDYVFEVIYELQPLDNGGHVIYNEEGKFAHYFSSNCNVSNIYSKKIVFLIDVSGSMKGIAIQQVRVAMHLILDQLRQTDRFNIVLFSDEIKTYSRSFLTAIPTNVLEAKKFIAQYVFAKGGTNMNEGLLTAIRSFDADKENVNFAQTLVFLTDGEPTKGVTRRSQIREYLKNANYYSATECCKSELFTIAFSKTADIEFLRALTYDHLGTLRVIRESLGQELSGELFDLYTEIHNPYYKNINFTYFVGEEPLPDTNITQSYFLHYDCGAEIVVGGETFPGSVVRPRVTAKGSKTTTEFDSIQTIRSNSIHAEMLTRLVAYKQVQEYVKVMMSSTDEAAVQLAEEKAVNISLQMEFVTPVTSLIVAFYPKKEKPNYNPPPAISNRGGFVLGRSEQPIFEIYEDEVDVIDSNGVSTLNTPKLVSRFLLMSVLFVL